MIEMGQAAGLACVFMRVTGCVLFNPIFGRRNFPRMFQIALTLALSMLIVTYSDVAVESETTFLGFCFLLLRELFVGFTMGIVVSTFMYIVILAGAAVDLKMGLMMANIYDPQSGIQMTVTGTNLNIMFILIFFGMDAHFTMVHLFLNSAELLPYGQAGFVNANLTMKILDVFCQCTILGLKLAMPIIGIIFLIEFGVGILMKAIPQINVFVLSLQIKILMGLLMLYLIFTPVASFIETTMTALFMTLGEVLIIMGA